VQVPVISGGSSEHQPQADRQDHVDGQPDGGTGLDPARPSPVIQARPGPYARPFHWENRRLRVPEIARSVIISIAMGPCRRALAVFTGETNPVALTRRSSGR